MKNKIKQKHSKLYILYYVSDVLLGLIFTFLLFGTTLINVISDPTVLSTTQIISQLVYIFSITFLMVILFWIFGIYDMVTTNFGMAEYLKIAIIVFAVNIVGDIFLIATPNTLIPRPSFALMFLETVVATMVIPSVRFYQRVIRLFHYFTSAKTRTNTVVIGAGGSAKIVIDDSRVNKNNKHRVVAIVDDDFSKIGGTMGNIPIEGPISNISEIIEKYHAEEVIIAISNLDRARLHEIITLLDECPVRVRRMPLLSEMNSPNAKSIIDVDLDDLLCRDPIKLDNSKVTEMLHGKTVMVTGAGGSIGSELVRQIFKTHPSTLVLFDIYENSTYDIQMYLVRKMREENIKDIELVTLIGSTYNETRVEQVIKKYRPDYIYHAAAYKHVPLMEDSPAEAIRTNVIGTYNVARLADKYKVKKMVLVSTDKAVRPTNTMGATKRFAETIIQYFAEKSKNTAYAAVRFGNVLGSNGSVVPLFKKQIEAGGPVTITHKEIIRYFMTIPEAVSLILQCGLFATGGEIFILDMGKPVKILNLAEKLIRQAGYIPYKDIQIVETGLRPGEKLFEELLLDIKTQTKTENKKIFIEEKSAVQPIEEEIKTISKVFDMEEKNDVKELLASIITTYTITNN